VMLGMVLAVTAWWFARRPRQPAAETVYDPTSQSTIIWRPYRTASAKLSPQFVHQLAKLEAELHQAAVDERWPVELTQREATFQKAQAALQQKNYSAALVEYAQALDLLIVGVQWQRKQLQQKDARAKAAAAGSPVEDSAMPSGGA
jgi:hypothetical protein